MTTKEDIQESINERLTSAPTQIEGGTIQDVVGSVAYELANIIDTRIDVILDNAFVTTADLEHLIIKGGELGISKKEASYAYVFATITGATANFTIETSVKAKTDDNIIFQVYEETTTDDDGYALVKMICLEAGTVGNIEENTLNEFYSKYQGLTSATITNENQGYNGYDEEDTEEYRERILEYLRNDACNSNIADYEAWAKEVSGVNNVVVYDATTAGAGNVDVYISAEENNLISDDLLEEVKEKIEEEQIINAKVNVYGMESVEINVTASIVLDDTSTIDSVTEEFKELLSDYLSSKPSVISYLYISNLLFEAGGISDVSDYLLNDSDSSITLDEVEIPIVGEITLITAEEE